MKNLDKIKSVFANSIYNYNPDHLHNSNGRSPTQRTHDGSTKGEFIRSDSMLERIMWGKFYRIDNIFYFNIRDTLEDMKYSGYFEFSENLLPMDPKSLRKNRMHLRSEDIDTLIRKIISFVEILLQRFYVKIQSQNICGQRRKLSSCPYILILKPVPTQDLFCIEFI
ncbi:hypothetical protein GLOIN_2v1594024 [Rhizophagus irregularis DAOM 181602=DAOM 197198]|nr:hypothetical protein GLOIN_2v1594024 [Rhizophagus irregularis DAOM 181602=DAOM 197198]